MQFPRHAGEDHTMMAGGDMAGMPMAAGDMAGMPGMDMSGGGTGANSHAAGMGGRKMPASAMSMVFFQSRHTALFFSGWVPGPVGEYAATCIFLILLAVIFRALLAVKAWKEAAWMDAEFNRRYVYVAGKGTKGDRMSTDSDAKRMVLTENGAEEGVVVVKKDGRTTSPWRFSVDPVRAALDTVTAAVGYFLMLAIMTMNVGYFLSVLSGTFLGSLALGRYLRGSEH